MIKALWLTSWYPNKLDEWNGDFIQRHAKAAALFCNVYVIHLEADSKNKLISEIEINKNKSGNLTEVMVMYKLHYGLLFISKIISWLRYIRLFKQQVDEYISKNGKPDIVHVHVPVKAGIVALWIKKKFRVRYVVTEHWAIYNNHAPDAYKKRNFIFRYFTKKILKSSALFLPVSKNLGKNIQKLVAKIKFHVVSNTVNTGFFTYQPLSQNDFPFTFIHVSTFKYQKNPEAILRAFKIFNQKFHRSKLLMVGEKREPLLAYHSSLNLSSEKVCFTGLVSYQEVAKLMQQSHALLMFSRFENLPCVIPEALCCGLPVISSDVGGISEIVNESNGYLVRSEDEEALLHAMTEVYQNYHSYKNKEISEEAIQKFSYQTIGMQIKEIYGKVIQKAL